MIRGLEFEKLNTSLRNGQKRVRICLMGSFWGALVLFCLSVYLDVREKGVSAFLSFLGHSLKEHLRISSDYYEYWQYFDEKSVSDILWQSFPVFVAFLIIFLGASLYYAFKNPESGKPLRGSQLLDNKDFQKHLLPSPKMPRGVSVCGINVPLESEYQHFLLLGDTGAGKTTVLRDMLYQVQDRKEAAIVFDPEGEYVREFYSEERGDVVLNPLDERCPFWSPWLEISGEGEESSITHSLIPHVPYDHNEYFQRSSRKLMKVLLQKVDSGNPRDLAELLNKPIDDIYQIIQGTEAASLIDPRAAQQAAGVISNLAGYVDPFLLLMPRSQGIEWSAKSWAENRKGWIFLTTKESHYDAIARLTTLWLDLLFKRILDTDLDAKTAESKNVWVFIDELHSLGKLNTLERFVTKVRKRGGKCVLGFQSIFQMMDKYGEKNASTMISQTRSKLFFASSDYKSAKWIVERVGDNEKYVQNQSFTASPEDIRDGVSISSSAKSDFLLLPSEIMGLKDHHAYFTYRGKLAGPDDGGAVITSLVKTVYREKLKVAESFVPRSGLQDIDDCNKSDKQEENFVFPNQETPEEALVDQDHGEQERFADQELKDLLENTR